MAYNSKDRVIRDSIHGDITLSDLEVELVDTPAMQRLRNIRQNGLCSYVYPSMTSTRFEHSLGVMHLAGKVGRHLNLKSKNSKALRAAGLLHDVGHAPFSHTSDELLSKRNIFHEEQSARIIQQTEVAKILRRHGLNPNLIADLVVGGGRMGKILSSEIDVDKMDYLLRDAHYAGVAYGLADLERIIESIKLTHSDVVLDAGSLEAVESLLISRGLMYQTVYWHKTKRIAESMLVEAIKHLFSKRKLSLKNYLSMDDIDLVSKLRASGGYPKEMMRRLDERRLFKTAYRVKLNSFSIDEQRNLAEKKDKIQNQIASETKNKKGFVLLDIPEAKLQEYKTKIEYEGELRRIDEVSTLARSLEQAEEERLTISVYALPEELNKFKKFNLSEYIQ
ncbi:MAG: HD domain-containing protein [Candidatus Altiarchaeota archaeon]